MKHENSADDYRQLYSQIYQTQDSKNAHISSVEACILGNSPANAESRTASSWFASSLGQNAADAGVYKFSPRNGGRSYNHLVAQYSVAAISVLVHPRATDIESLKKTVAAYTDASGKSQTSEYTGEEVINGHSYSRSSAIKITPCN
ncbi:MAG: hypothetical protein LBP35_02815 [Candidatus Ancillula trichonymphae]|nr:hypothetical protein [Candidatus Ancillula trichonymphae]